MWRGLFRYRLRTFLLAVTLFAMWLAFHVRETHRQYNAVRRIREYGGWVYYDHQFPAPTFGFGDPDVRAGSHIPATLVDLFGVDCFHAVVQVELNYKNNPFDPLEEINLSDEALQFVGDLRRLRVLLLSDTQASDESLRHLTRLGNLERLYMWDAARVSDDGVRHLVALKELRLSNSQITDEAMKVFATLPNLEELSLQGHSFSNDALKYIGRSAKLKSLVIGGGQITVDDSGLEHLKGLQRLERLGIQKSCVTDSGLVHLEGLSNLKTIWVSEDQVAGPGLTKLKARLPKLTLNAIE